MKGRISKTLRKILADELGRKTLEEALLSHSDNSTVTCSDGKSYKVRTINLSELYFSADKVNYKN